MTDGFAENYEFLARYNRWINQRIYDGCDTLTDQARKLDRGAFFGSVHGTLNHLIVADQVWLGRLAQCGKDNKVEFQSLSANAIDMPPGIILNSWLYEDWASLRARRIQLDAAIQDWIDELPEGFGFFKMRYSNSKGVQREHPAWQAITHFFNHQTHHRGQVTTLLYQAGVDIGVTDLIALV